MKTCCALTNSGRAFSVARWLSVVLMLLGGVASSSAATSTSPCPHHRGVVEAGPDCLSKTTSITEALRQAHGNNVHILYVHGIAAEGPGDSLAFQESICKQLRDCTSPQPGETAYRPVRYYANHGDFDPTHKDWPHYEYFANPKAPGTNYIWSTKEEWVASTPFVDHYRIQRQHGKSLFVDEINWWPLVFPLKCRYMVKSEAHLSGPDTKYLELCSASKDDGDHGFPDHFASYPWIDRGQAETLMSSPKRAASLNRDLKGYVIDWGFSDAMLAVGSLQPLFQEAMRQLMAESKENSIIKANEDPLDGVPEFIVVSHSLGSFLVFSTLQDATVLMNKAPQELAVQAAPDHDICSKLVSQDDDSGSDVSGDAYTGVPYLADEETGIRHKKQALAACYIFTHTSQVYFFANQLSLLELANVKKDEVKRDDGNKDGASPSTLSTAASLSTVAAWASLRRAFLGSEQFKNQCPQLVAWSDPSDLLTLRVPRVDFSNGEDRLRVANLYVKNASHWFGAIENPGSAHSKYAVNKSVLEVMLPHQKDSDDR